MRIISATFCLLLLGGCATTLPEDRVAQRDPLEGFNRGMWKVNDAVDTVMLKPATKAYRTVTPKPARRGISRIFANLSEPFSAMNNLLQGKPKRAGRNLGRFLVNSTIGVGGLADHATGMGLAPADEDFGQTLARWGVGGGPYLVLPILGPSTLRDGFGATIYQVTDPHHIAVRSSSLSSTAKIGLTTGEIINIRSDLIDNGVDSFLETSLDPYAAARSAFLQRRHAQSRDAENAPPAENDVEEPIILENDSASGDVNDTGAPPETPATAPATQETAP